MPTITASPQLLQKFDDFQIPLTGELTRRLLLRARSLPDHDRTLLEFILTGRSNFSQFARAARCTTATVSRRFHRLLLRLEDPFVLWLLKNNSLPPLQRRLGLESCLQGIPLNELARRHHLKRHAVRAHLQFLRGWYSAQKENSRAHREHGD